MYEGEEIHDLPAPGYRLIQDRSHFRYGTDAVLLADFCRPDKDARAADLGAGTGAVSLLLLAREKAARVDAVELQPRLCDMMRRSAQLNGLSGRMSVYEADLRRLAGTLEAGAYGCVVCNPPYRAAGTGRVSPDPARRVALFETECTLPEVLAAGLRLLRSRKKKLRSPDGTTRRPGTMRRRLQKRRLGRKRPMKCLRKRKRRRRRRRPRMKSRHMCR